MGSSSWGSLVGWLRVVGRLAHCLLGQSNADGDASRNCDGLHDGAADGLEDGLVDDDVVFHDYSFVVVSLYSM